MNAPSNSDPEQRSVNVETGFMVNNSVIIEPIQMKQKLAQSSVSTLAARPKAVSKSSGGDITQSHREGCCQLIEL